MAGTWSQLGSVSLTFKGDPFPVTCLAFDPLEEVIWTGAQDGRLSCFSFPAMERRVSVMAHPRVPPHLLSNNTAGGSTSPAKNASAISAPADSAAIVGIIPAYTGVTTVSSHSVRFHSRGGMLQLAFSSERLSGIKCCVVPSPARPELLLGGTNGLALYDLEANKIIQEYEVESPAEAVTCLCTTTRGLILAATHGGTIQVRDPRQLKLVAGSIPSVVTAHSGPVVSMDTRGELAATAGLAKKPFSQPGSPEYSPDAFIHVYDVRQMRALAPLHFRRGGPSMLRFIPSPKISVAGSLVAVSTNGALQFFEADPESAVGKVELPFLQVGVDPSVAPGPVAGLTSMAVSSSGECLAFGDAAGFLHLWAETPESAVNVFSQPLEPLPEFPTNTEKLLPDLPPLPQGDFTEDSPFSLIPLPVFEGDGSPLLSTWPTSKLQAAMQTLSRLGKHGTLTPLDASLIPDLKQNDFVGYAPVPKNGFLPNHAESYERFTAARTTQEKPARATRVGQLRNFEFLSSPQRREMRIPKDCAKVKIKIPRWGLSSFDFSAYNTTSFTGLDNLLPHSYCNSVLQLLYFIPPLRVHMLNHLCYKESCITCELGFLFHMLDMARKGTVEPRNFLRILAQIPEAAALGLLDPPEPSAELMLAVKIQDFLRFLLEQLNKEINEAREVLKARHLKLQQKYEQQLRMLIQQQQHMPPGQPPLPPPPPPPPLPPFNNTIEQVFGAEVEHILQCQTAISRGLRHDSQSRKVSFHFKLTYPPPTVKPPAFTEVLANSLCETATRQVWCDKCSAYSPVKHQKVLRSLPAVLVLHCNINTDDELDIWRSPHVCPSTASLHPSHSAGNLLASFDAVANAPSSDLPPVAADDSALPSPSSSSSSSSVSPAASPALRSKRSSSASATAAAAPAVSASSSSANSTLPKEFADNSWLPYAFEIELPEEEEEKKEEGEAQEERKRKEGEERKEADALAAAERRKPRIRRLTREELDRLPELWEGQQFIKKKPVATRSAAASEGTTNKTSESSSSGSTAASASAALALTDDSIVATSPVSSLSPEDEKIRAEKKAAVKARRKAIYRLSAVISHVTDPPEKDSPLNTVNGEHLVAHIRVPPPYGATVHAKDRWHVFNDFVISPSSPEQAVKFRGYLWRQPCIVSYTRVDVADLVPIEEEGQTRIHTAIFRADESLSQAVRIRPPPPPTFVPVTPQEKIRKNALVAIDCEFVAVELEETKQRPDGTIEVIKPGRHTLGRVSVVRGEGSKIGIPMIDDYILTSEPVVDYLTRFSGLRPGDLDRNLSPHHLTTLKHAYIKLRSLVDRGVRFVGHGLTKDFQIINLVVPKEQIIDTSELFHLPNQRKLGLRFLAAYLLGRTIQVDTHDSIEDARTALALYRLYEALKALGADVLDQTLKNLYRIGFEYGWQADTFPPPSFTPQPSADGKQQQQPQLPSAIPPGVVLPQHLLHPPFLGQPPVPLNYPSPVAAAPAAAVAPGLPAPSGSSPLVAARKVATAPVAAAGASPVIGPKKAVPVPGSVAAAAAQQQQQQQAAAKRPHVPVAYPQQQQFRPGGPVSPLLMPRTGPHVPPPPPPPAALNAPRPRPTAPVAAAAAAQHQQQQQQQQRFYPPQQQHFYPHQQQQQQPGPGRFPVPPPQPAAAKAPFAARQAQQQQQQRHHAQQQQQRRYQQQQRSRGHGAGPDAAAR